VRAAGQPPSLGKRRLAASLGRRCGPGSSTPHWPHPGGRPALARRPAAPIETALAVAGAWGRGRKALGSRAREPIGSTLPGEGSLGPAHGASDHPCAFRESPARLSVIHDLPGWSGGI